MAFVTASPVALALSLSVVVNKKQSWCREKKNLPKETERAPGYYTSITCYSLSLSRSPWHITLQGPPPLFLF